MTIKTPEQIAKAVADEAASVYASKTDRINVAASAYGAALAAIEADRAQRREQAFAELRALDEEIEAGYQFAHPDDEDRYRDLWNENMPRVSGCMYFAIPGEQPIHVTDEEAHHIMTYLSKENR